VIASPDGLAAFRARWIARRDALRQLHALVDGAELCDALLGELDTLLAASAGELLSLRQAAAESGYSPDHLGRLIREGKLPNAGRLHAPRIRRGHLPMKQMPQLASHQVRAYDPVADARSLASRP
jgi:hypothetical protein